MPLVDFVAPAKCIRTGRFGATVSLECDAVDLKELSVGFML